MDDSKLLLVFISYFYVCILIGYPLIIQTHNSKLSPYQRMLDKGKLRRWVWIIKVLFFMPMILLYILTYKIIKLIKYIMFDPKPTGEDK